MAAGVVDRASWGRRISVHAAAALLAFTLLHIFCFTAVSGYTGARWVNLLGIAILIGLVIPLVSKVEARWQGAVLGDLSEAAIVARFRRERLLLWIGALLIPFVWTGLFFGLYMLADRLIG